MPRVGIHHEGQRPEPTPAQGNALGIAPVVPRSPERATQPKAWELLTKIYGAKAADALLTRLREQLDQRGTLEVLRQGIDLLGLKQSLKLAEFKPALAINPDILARYGANRLRVVRHEGDPAEPCRALGIAAGEGGELRERRKCAPPGR